MSPVPSKMRSTLKLLKWPFLVLVIFVGTFATFYVFIMYSMQTSQLAKIREYIDIGELGNISHLVYKDMIITRGLLLLSYIISICCFLLIIIFLYVSLLRTKKIIKLKYNRVD